MLAQQEFTLLFEGFLFGVWSFRLRDFCLVWSFRVLLSNLSRTRDILLMTDFLSFALPLAFSAFLRFLAFFFIQWGSWVFLIRDRSRLLHNMPGEKTEI